MRCPDPVCVAVIKDVVVSLDELAGSVAKARHPDV